MSKLQEAVIGQSLVVAFALVGMGFEGRSVSRHIINQKYSLASGDGGLNFYRVITNESRDSTADISTPPASRKRR
jgi:hypothetical protein